MAGNSSGFGNLLKEVKHDWPSILLIVTALAAGIVFYPDLPDQMPAHWNIKGEVDRYTSKFWGTFGIPLTSAFIYVLMLIVPYFDPKRQNYIRFMGSYRVLKFVMTGVFSVLYAVVLLNSMGYGVPVDRVVIIALGLMFMVIGNVMGRFRHNYFVGIKTPWTLASEEVWQKTHRFSARIWVFTGLVIVLVGAVIGGERGYIVFFGAIGLAVLVPFVYSYLIFRKEKR